MNVRCPRCRQVSEMECNLVSGQHIICSCGHKFTWVSESGHTHTLSAGIAGFGGIIKRIRLCISLVADVILLWRKPRLIRCPFCGLQQVYYANNFELNRKHVCSCGHPSYLHQMIYEYKRSQAVLSQHYEEMTSLVKDEYTKKGRVQEFKEQEMRFEEDWKIYSNPQMGRKISRLKEDTDRLYKRLQIANTNRVVGAVHSAEASNAIVGNTFEGAMGFLVSLAGAVDQYNAEKNEEVHTNSVVAITDAISRNEEAIDYYADLCDEFEGVDKDTAHANRFTRLFGLVDASQLPRPIDDESLKLACVERDRAQKAIGVLEGDERVCSKLLINSVVIAGVTLLLALLFSILHFTRLPTWKDVEADADAFISNIQAPTKKFPDYVKDRAECKSRAERGDAEAKFYLGVLQAFSKVDAERDEEEGLRLIEESARAGCCLALECMGDIYSNGKLGLEKDLEKAFDCYNQALRLNPNSPYLQRMVGYMLVRGLGTSVNHKKAYSLLRKASKGGDAQAMKVYAAMLVAEDVPVSYHDYKKGVFWAACAAKLGLPDACRIYAGLLSDGRGVVPDSERSAYWMNKADAQ